MRKKIESLDADLEFTSHKFLTKAKAYALNHRDVAIPYAEPELYAAKMWVLGVLMALRSSGYKITKDS